MFANVIAIEGADACGKHTQSVMLQKKMQALGLKTKLVEVPVNDGITHWLIYKMLKDGSAKQNPNLFQFVQFLNKYFFQWTYFLWLWWTCDVIILDRWSLSSIVYGEATGSNMSLCKLYYALLDDPHLTIILDGPSHRRDREKDSYERDSELQLRVKATYRKHATNTGLPIYVINNQGHELAVHARIMELVQDVL